MFDINGDQLSIPIPPDNEGYTGRECPKCKAYFKIVFGTGPKGTSVLATPSIL